MTTDLEAFQAVVQAALPILAATVRQQLPPDEAVKLLEPLRAGMPALSLRLTGEFERASARYSYDLLLRLPGQPTLCLSCSADEALPWSMRGAQYWQESHLVRVDDSVLTIDQALTEMEVQLRDASVTDRFVHSCLAREEIARQGITPDGAQVQEAMDALRRTYGLLTAEATHEWLARRGMRHFDLERIARNYAAVRELKRRIADDRVEPHFESNRPKYCQADVLTLQYACEQEAMAAAEGFRSGTMDAARLLAAIGATISQSSHGAGGVLRTLTADDPGTHAIFSDHERVTSPRLEQGRYLVHVVLMRRDATLDDRTRAAIAEELFSEWLAERRKCASITWYWGDPTRIRGA